MPMTKAAPENREEAIYEGDSSRKKRATIPDEHTKRLRERGLISDMAAARHRLSQE